MKRRTHVLYSIFTLVCWQQEREREKLQQINSFPNILPNYYTRIQCVQNLRITISYDLHQKLFSKIFKWKPKEIAEDNWFLVVFSMDGEKLTEIKMLHNKTKRKNPVCWMNILTNDSISVEMNWNHILKEQLIFEALKAIIMHLQSSKIEKLKLNLIFGFVPASSAVHRARICSLSGNEILCSYS